MSDPGDHDQRVASLIREIAAERAKADPDKKALRRFCREIGRLRGGYPPQASSVVFHKSKKAEILERNHCAIEDGAVVQVVHPPSDSERDERLGLVERTPVKTSKQQTDAAILFRRIFEYFLGGKRDLAVIGKKVIVFAHYLQPDLIGHITTMELAAELGCTKQEISRIGSIMRQMLGVRSGRYRSDMARTRMSTAARGKQAEGEHDSNA